MIVLSYRKIKIAPKYSPLCCKPTKCHFNSNLKLRQIEVVWLIVHTMLHCPTKWDQQLIALSICIVTNKEVFIWHRLQPFAQSQTTIDYLWIICPAGNDNAKISKLLVASHSDWKFSPCCKEIICGVINVWFLDASKPIINCSYNPAPALDVSTSSQFNIGYYWETNVKFTIIVYGFENFF